MKRWTWLSSSCLFCALAFLLVISVTPAAPQTVPVQHSPTQIYQKTGVAEGQGGLTVLFQFDVPPGKVLVVESVSARVFVPTGQNVSAQVNCNGASLSGQFASASKFLLFQETTLASADRFDAHHFTRCYVAGTRAGSELNAVVQRDSSAGLFESVDVSISGYLINP